MTNKFYEPKEVVEVKALAIAENDGKIADLIYDVAEILVEKYEDRKGFNKWPEFEAFVKGYVAGYHARATDGKKPTSLWVQSVWEAKRSDPIGRRGTLEFQSYNTAYTQFMRVLATAFPLPKREGGGGTRGVNIPKFITAISGDDQELANALRWALDHPEDLKAAYKAAAKRPKRKVANE